MASITAQKQKFIEAYLISSNATEQGSRLLTNVDIQAAIQHAQNETKERNKMTVDDIIKELESARKIAGYGQNASAMIAATMAKAKILGLDKPAEKEKPPVNGIKEFDKMMTEFAS
jgi:phage terminase small subunit